MAKQEISHKELAHTVPFTEVGIPTIQETQGSRGVVQGSNTRESDGVDPSPSSEGSVLRFMQVRKRSWHECPPTPTPDLCSVLQSSPQDWRAPTTLGMVTCFTESTNSNAYPLSQHPHRHTQN